MLAAIQFRLSSRLLSKNVKINIYRIILLVFVWVRNSVSRVKRTQIEGACQDTCWGGAAVGGVCGGGVNAQLFCDGMLLQRVAAKSLLNFVRARARACVGCKYRLFFNFLF